ncbi:IS1595 family transposase [Oceanibacterium hippocampi]|uniref:ISXO2-like transposase domain protein n=1 Tax=Oceanibacterium hippocampi TaxID=745714 RepID=A0A1Y5TYN1_9PROT|nr:IS1595 family transposase [Oceanibacterium hippocampi]SLN76834.1 ISXO2-like transposase domain protein [Oceanibacterium hippocampi]
MAKQFTIQDFFNRFPTDEACLEHLMLVRYGTEGDCPKCSRHTKFHRIRKEPAWECQWCGHHIHPMAGTPFARTRTPLQKWFYAMYLFTTTRNGVSAKELERQLGVTYKTAWRIGHEIRKYMGWVDGDAMLGGQKIVEVDKVFIGGRDEQGQDDKYIVLGMVERGGDIITRVIPNRSRNTVTPHITEWVKQGTRVATDQAGSFVLLSSRGYRHGVVNHAAKEYVRGPVHTNTIESFWAALKRGVEGTYIWVSDKHLSSYLAEFEFRFNLRKQPHLMFDLLVQAFPKP